MTTGARSIATISMLTVSLIEALALTHGHGFLRNADAPWHDFRRNSYRTIAACCSCSGQ